MIITQNWTDNENFQVQFQGRGKVWETPAGEIASALFKQLNSNYLFLWVCTLVTMLWRYTATELPRTYNFTALYYDAEAGVW